MNIKNAKPLLLKIKKHGRRIVSFVVWFGLLFISIHHIELAVKVALRAKISHEDFTKITQSRLCSGQIDVGEMLGGAANALWVGICAFLNYFYDHKWAAIILGLTIFETCRHLLRGKKTLRRIHAFWKMRRNKPRD